MNSVILGEFGDLGDFGDFGHFGNPTAFIFVSKVSGPPSGQEKF